MRLTDKSVQGVVREVVRRWAQMIEFPLWSLEYMFYIYLPLGKDKNEHVVRVFVKDDRIEHEVGAWGSWSERLDLKEWADCHNLTQRAFPALSTWNMHSEVFGAKVTWNVAYRRRSSAMNDLFFSEHVYCVWDVNDVSRGSVPYEPERAEECLDNIRKYGGPASLMLTHEMHKLWKQGKPWRDEVLNASGQS